MVRILILWITEFLERIPPWKLTVSSSWLLLLKITPITISHVNLRENSEAQLLITYFLKYGFHYQKVDIGCRKFEFLKIISLNFKYLKKLCANLEIVTWNIIIFLKMLRNLGRQIMSNRASKFSYRLTWDFVIGSFSKTTA